jgi:hypothetical protein
MKNLKWVFYFESLLMGITVVLGIFFPVRFLAQLSPEVPTALTVELARWYGVPFIPLTLIQLDTLRSGNRYALKLVMLTYLLTDITQLTVTIIFADRLGWAMPHFISAGTALLFIASRAACYQNLDRLGVRLTA